MTDFTDKKTKELLEPLAKDFVVLLQKALKKEKTVFEIIRMWDEFVEQYVCKTHEFRMIFLRLVIERYIEKSLPENKIMFKSTDVNV